MDRVTTMDVIANHCPYLISLSTTVGLRRPVRYTFVCRVDATGRVPLIHRSPSTKTAPACVCTCMHACVRFGLVVRRRRRRRRRADVLCLRCWLQRSGCDNSGWNRNRTQRAVLSSLTSPPPAVIVTSTPDHCTNPQSSRIACAHAPANMHACASIHAHINQRVPCHNR